MVKDLQEVILDQARHIHTLRAEIDRLQSYIKLQKRNKVMAGYKKEWREKKKLEINNG